MSESNQLHEVFKQISEDLRKVNQTIEQVIPHVLVKDALAFGNSSHVVLSKELRDKKVGVIVLGDDKTLISNVQNIKRRMSK